MNNIQGCSAMLTRGLVLAVSLASGAVVCGCRPGTDDRDLAYHRARHALEEGRWDWARIYLAEDLQLNPNRIESVRDLGIAWISGHGGGLSHGVPYLRDYLERRPGDAVVLRRFVSTLIRLDRHDQAWPWAEKLDEHDESFLLKAHLMAGSDPRGALDQLARVFERDPDHGGAHALAAAVLESLGDQDRAVLHASRAVEIDVFDLTNRTRLLRLWRTLGRTQLAEEGLAAMDVVNRLNQSVEAARLAPAEELRLLRRLEELDEPNGYVFLRRLTEALLAAGRVREGVEALARLRDEPRFSIEDRLILAGVLFGCREHHQARLLYESVLEEDSRNVTATASLALLDCSLGRAEEAKSRMTAALEGAPHVAKFHAVLGQARLLSGDETGAVKSFETALHLAPWQHSWRVALAAIHRAEGSRANAEKLLAFAPEDAPALPYHGGRSTGPGRDLEPARSVPARPEPPVQASTSEGDWFTEISARVGVDFAQFDGRSGRRYYVETTGSGCGVFDYDGDGDQDLYLLTGAPTPGSALVSPPRNALFENVGGRFVEATDRAGLGDTGFGMGLCVGDYDGDGLIDLMVTNYGPDSLYRNLGDGRFREVASTAGVDDPRWSSSCAFGDLDGDDDLDLYVSHYLDAGFDNNPFCGDRARDLSAYCRPSVFEGVSDSLFINRGDGTFVEEGGWRGIAQGVLEKGFGVVLTDIDDDADLDIFVANDATPNRMYINDGTGSFDDVALAGGLALNFEGMPTSGMGADIGDVDGDGLQDVVLTNYAMESNGLYRNLGGLIFEDVSQSRGLAGVSRPQVGWGTRLFDFDNDGDLDLAVANGHVVDNIELFEPDATYPQLNRLMANDGAGVFSDVTDPAGPAWAVKKVSRALAVVDWNDDGRLDLVIANCNQRFDLLENRLDTGNHWIGLVLEGPPSNRFALGARVVLVAGSLRQMREVRSGGGFQAQSDLRLHFGLADHDERVQAEIRWPDGHRQIETVTMVDRYHTLSYR